MIDNRGWIKLHRSMTDWEWYDDLPACRLWIHLLLTVNHEDKDWRGITIPKGSRFTSVGKLALETGLTDKQVRTALKKLESTNNIIVQGRTNGTLLTLVNWELYQSQDTPKGKQKASKGQTRGEQRATTKECKNERNKEIYSELSDELQNALAEFENMRKQIKKPVTSDNTRKRILSDLKKLADLDSPQAIAIVNQSTDRCWQGLYPLSKDYEVKTNTEEIKKNNKEAIDGLKQKLSTMKAELESAQQKFQADKSQKNFAKLTQLRTDIGRLEEMIAKGEK